MNYRYQKINPQLENYIRSILVLENTPNSESMDLPLFTEGMPALLCKTGNDNNRIALYGQSVPHKEWIIEKNTTLRQNSGQALIAFFFKPFTIGPAFKLSAQELKDKCLELNLWNAQKTMALNVQLLHSQSTEKKIDVLNHFILSQIQTNQRQCEIIRYATDKLMQNSNPDALLKLLQEL